MSDKITECPICAPLGTTETNHRKALAYMDAQLSALLFQVAYFERVVRSHEGSVSESTTELIERQLKKPLPRIRAASEAK